MNYLRSINVIRKKLMMGLTKNVGNSHINTNVALFSKNENIRILISRPNHRLGNQLLMTPLVQEVIATFPNCKIDLFVKGNIASILFKKL